MTPVTAIVVLACGGAGYWLVSHLMNYQGPPLGREADADKPKSKAKPEQKPEKPAPSTRHWSEVLQVPLTASKAEVTAAYRSMIGKYHTDKVARLGPEFQELAEAKSKEINTAYEQAQREV